MQNSLVSVCRNVIEAPNGNFIMIGLTYDSLNYFNYLSIVGTDPQGNMLWRKDYGNANFEYLDNILAARGAVCTDNNAFYHAVCVREGSQYVSALLKFNYSGDTLWQKIYREPSWDLYVQGISKSVDGGFLMTGFFQNSVSSQCLLIKTDINGNELWRKKISKAVPNVMDGNSIVQDSSSKKIIIVGYQYIGNASSWSTYSNVLILDSLGNTILQTTFNNAGGGGGFLSLCSLETRIF
ncbi:hypothetical protein [Aurantibacillus circumpalustris]|uniref:hypothetical protein n=1 Tax=Aurantibacillus circumpalustris TaxID=3036359 RepID=UPI00295B7EF0|nr:hypothetical protein [Aurantibacillus circumpalustris]